MEICQIPAVFKAPFAVMVPLEYLQRDLDVSIEALLGFIEPRFVEVRTQFAYEPPAAAVIGCVAHALPGYVLFPAPLGGESCRLRPGAASRAVFWAW